MLANLQPAVRALLIANVLIFGAQWVLPELIDHFALWPLAAGFQPWQIITYGFLHGGIAHLAFNMVGLVSFGNELEQYWGTTSPSDEVTASWVSAAAITLAK